MKGCPSPGELQAYADGELARGEGAVLGRHIDSCPSCQAIMSEIAESDRMIGALFSLELIPAAPPFSLPLSATRPRWLGLSCVIVTLAALVSYLAWKQISPLVLMLEDNVWLAGRTILNSIVDRLAGWLPELIIQLADGRLGNEQLLMQGIVQGMVIIFIAGFFSRLKSQPPARRHQV